MPYTQEQENYFKLITLIYCFGANVNRELLHRFLHSTNTTLEQFINDHQHEIYHFFSNAKCCQCKKKAIPPKPKVINHHQMLSIFANSHTDRLDNHQNQRTEQLCCLKANKSVELKDLDFTLIRFFLVQFCYQVFWDCHLKNENKSFSAFLVENVHKVYHLSVDKICCCMCNVDRDIPDRCIHQKQFEIICKQGSLPCPHPFCSCQYTIQSDLTLSSLIQQDTDLTTKLTKHFCSCLKFLENIYENRNKIAHHPNCCINNDTFWDIWNETKPNILEVAKALDKENEYEADLQELIDGPSNKLVFLTVVLNLLKTSEHVTVNTLQKIEGKADSIEDKIGAVYSLVEDIKIAKFNNMNSSDCSGLSIVNSLRDIAIALCKEKSSEGNADNFQKKEVSFELKIQVNPASIQTAQGSEDDNSDLDTPEDSFTCGRCQENFNKLKQFCKHKETCDTKRVKPGKQILEISGKFIISEASERLEKNAAKMFQDNPDQFDTNEIDVRYVERGCLIVWTESSQYDLENEDKLKKDCIQFTKNMFEKCSLDSTESTNIKVNVKFSKTFQDSSETKDDQSDYLHCGSCRQEFSTINSFISHKKECIRNRKISKQKQEDILKLPQISEESPETISRTKSDSTNQFISSQTGILKKTEDVDLKTSRPIAEDEKIPSEIRLMSDKTSVPLYLKLLESGSQKKRDIRLVIVGKKGTGKTSFIKRLLDDDITQVTTTDGIDVNIKRCNANSEDGIWNKSDGIKEKSELDARLLKPYHKTLISHGKGTNEASVESSVHKAIMKSLKTNLDETDQSEAESLQPNKIKLPVVTEVKHPVTAEHQYTFSVDTTSQDQIQSLQLEQAHRDIKTMLKSEVDLFDKEEYATLLLWDFAGGEEFYYTDQTFLSVDAIYLVVTKLNEADNKEAQETFRLWMDSIHCYSRQEDMTDISDDNTRMTDDLDPPVVIVGTWKDALLSGSAENDEACRKNLLMFTENIPEKVRGHIRNAVFISNTEDDKSVFHQIRQNIFELARTTRMWNKDYPLKFIQLDKRLQEKKKRLPIIDFSDLKVMATETSMPLNDDELILYLKYHHESRALIYFEDIPDCIILNTKWLSDTFKYIVTPKQFQAVNPKNRKRWDEFYCKGKLHGDLIEELFKNQESILYRHKYHILNVMENFDMIIRPIKSERNAAGETSCYYVPCMIKEEPECDIYKMFNITEGNCKKSTWLCFKFRFLPPHLMNYLIASLCKIWEFAEVGVTEHVERHIITQQAKKQIIVKQKVERVFALYKGTAVFELENTTKLSKLLLTTYRHFILIQILEFGERAFTKTNWYKHIADLVTNKINNIISARFKMTNVKFEKKWECGLTKPESVTGSKDLHEEYFMEYFCEMCRTTHDYTNEWSGLQRKPVLLTKEEFNFAKTGMIVLNVFGDVLFDLLKQDKPNLRPRRDCDITYLYSEHRRLNKHIPSNRWGGSWQTIQSTDIAIGDDIERIRLTRNELLQSRIFKLDEIRFNGLCTIIADLLKRFDHHNKPARLYTDHFYEIISKTIHDEEGKGVMHQLEHEIESGGMRQSPIVSEESGETSSLTGFTKEEFNFAKTWMIVLNIFGDVLFDLLKQDKPNLPPRRACDITYLYSEHRRLNKHIPSNRWGRQWQNIHITDIAIGDDIERMRLIRNELQHSKVFELDEQRYYELSKIIVDLLKRFDHHNKPRRLYTDQLNEIIAKTISEEEVNVVHHRIENEIKSEMAFEVDIEHKVKVEPQ